MLDRAPCPITDNKVRFDLAVLERFEQSHTENCAGCAGQANDQTSHLSSPLWPNCHRFTRVVAKSQLSHPCITCRLRRDFERLLMAKALLLVNQNCATGPQPIARRPSMGLTHFQRPRR